MYTKLETDGLLEKLHHVQTRNYDFLEDGHIVWIFLPLDPAPDSWRWSATCPGCRPLGWAAVCLCGHPWRPGICWPELKLPGTTSAGATGVLLCSPACLLNPEASFWNRKWSSSASLTVFSAPPCTPWHFRMRCASAWWPTGTHHHSLSPSFCMDF